MLITFGRAASQELRERVRDRIVHALKAFDDESVVGDNQVVKHCSTGSPTSAPRGNGTCGMQWPVSTRRTIHLRISSVSSC